MVEEVEIKHDGAGRKRCWNCWETNGGRYWYRPSGLFRVKVRNKIFRMFAVAMVSPQKLYKSII